MKQGITYTMPALCSYGNDIAKNWFVYFDITEEGTGIITRKQFRGGINTIKNVKDRLVAGEELKNHWTQKLKDGWSPFLYSVNSLNKMHFNEAVDWALTKCEVAGKTKIDYTGTAEFFKTAAKKLKLDKALITGIKRRHILLMLDQIKEDRGWSNHAVNKNVGYFSAILSRLKKYEIIEHNPAVGIEDLPVAETMMFEPYTEAEKILIREKLMEIHPAFFTYLMVIYHTGIRPKEVLALRIHDILFDRRLILIKPDLKEENSKTKNIRMVPINDHMAALLLDHIKSNEKEMYVFGSPFKSGSGNCGTLAGKKGAMRPDYFQPSFVQVKRDTATKLWNTLVIKGMGINKYMYAMKHTGGDDKILAGVSLDALREMYGHSSKFMTEKYARQVKGVYQRQIIANSPNF